jgi:hypothetical protein
VRRSHGWGTRNLFFFEDLRRIDEKVDRVIDDVRDLKVRITKLEEGQAGIAGWIGWRRDWTGSSGVSILSNRYIEFIEVIA